MSNRCIRLIGVLLVLVSGPGLALASENLELPDDLVGLLPADPAVLVVISSVDDLSREWNRLDAMMNVDGVSEPVDVAELLAEHLPRFEEIVDPGRPLALSLDLTPVIMGQEPYLTHFVPLKASFTDRDSIGIDAVNTVAVVRGDYVAISTKPGFAPAATPPALGAGMLAGVVSASLDLEGMLATYGPFVEMGLAGIPVASAVPDTNDSGEIVPSQGMTVEEAEALKDMVRALMQSARRMDLSLGISGDQIQYRMKFAVLPGSPLEPGPQPDFGEALALTGFLPPGEDILQVVALDQTRQFEVFKPFYEANMKRETAKLDGPQAEKYAAWFQEYLGMVDLWAHPMASALKVSEDGMMAHVVMKSPDAAGDLDRLAAILDGLSAADIGIRLEAGAEESVEGTAVRNWIVEYDQEKMKGFTGTPANPQLTGMGRMQAEQMSAFLRKVVPGVHLAARNNLLFISAENGTAGLAGMMAAAAKSASPHPEAARIAGTAGPGVRQIVAGDLLAILNWATEMMEELDRQERDTIAGNPIPFDGALTIEGPVYGFGMAMDMEAMGRVIKAVEALDPDDEAEEPAPAPGADDPSPEEG